MALIGNRNIRAISLKFLLFCCFEFDPIFLSKIHIFGLSFILFLFNFHMVQDFGSFLLFGIFFN